MDSPLPSVTGQNAAPISILLINPNSSSHMTDNCLKSIASKLPAGVTVHGFTAPRPAPSAIEGRVDGILSSAECLRAIVPMQARFDAFLVCCFSHHPLVDALREEVAQPVLGIMEASLYAARMCGSRLGVVTTSERSAVNHELAVAAYGFERYSAGCVASRISVPGLDSQTREVVLAGVVGAARKLVEERGADAVCLGCAGMMGVRKACEEALGTAERQVMVVDGVAVGVQFLTALVRDSLGTAKRGAYRPAKEGRDARNQEWY
ncbi:Asp/Glu/hydantoin racemase [Apiospora arundinis]|uniref:Asp/Glu/hydantoin racemase n=1 Tax=Apiospora arundinis TaxID=335852 RepID=A0ABR2I7W2_9PEZI